MLLHFNHKKYGIQASLFMFINLRENHIPNKCMFIQMHNLPLIVPQHLCINAWSCYMYVHVTSI